MSQEKNSILKDDFYSMIQMQRVKVDDEYKLLLQDPNNEQMQVYQTLIKDFVTMAVKQFYIVVMSSAKEELSQYNLYDYANKVDDLLNINQCIENEDTVSLTQYHKQIDELLDKFIYIN